MNAKSAIQFNTSTKIGLLGAPTNRYFMFVAIKGMLHEEQINKTTDPRSGFRFYNTLSNHTPSTKQSSVRIEAYLLHVPLSMPWHGKNVRIKLHEISEYQQIHFISNA